ncbi:MAG: fumarylacetoacetate hydrolase family protein [Candidatus Acidiferrales bacterium]
MRLTMEEFLRIVNFRRGQELRLGVVQGESVFDLQELSAAAGKTPGFFLSAGEFLNAGAEALDFARSLAAGIPAGFASLALKALELGPPVPKPSKIIAVGLNYRDHAGEANFKVPEYPLIFAKFPNSVAGPHDAIVIPSEEMQVDSEAELAVVIGRRGKAIRADEAFDYVAGYMALNDVSARKWQFADKQWTRGKSCDTFCPTGPWLTTRDEIADPHKLRVIGRVNGEVFQDSNTAKLIFGVPELIAFISEAITLEPGDIIATGTPSGVGVFRHPPVFMKAGDVAEVEIEGLGVLRNAAVGAGRS